MLKLPARSLRAVLIIGGGTLASQFILLAATPLLSRLYSPDSFGAFASLVAVASIVGPSAALKFDAGIVLPKEQSMAGTVLRLAFWSALVTSLVSCGAVWMLGVLGLGSAWSGVDLAPFWVGALVFLTASFTTLTQAALRGQAYSLVAKRAPIQSVGTAIAQIGFWWLVPSAMGLLGGFVVGRLTGLTPLVRSALPLFSTRGTSWRAALAAYWRLPVMLAPSALMNSLGSQVPLLAVAALFGANAAGEFSMTQRVAYIPITLIGASVAQVFAAELAKHVREGGHEAMRFYWRTSRLLAAIAVPVAIAIVLVGPWALPVVLGPGWTVAGDLCRPIGVLVGISLVATPTSQVYTVFQSAASLLVDLSRVVLLGIALAIIVLIDLDLLEASWFLVAAQGVNYVFTWSYGLRITRRAGK